MQHTPRTLILLWLALALCACVAEPTPTESNGQSNNSNSTPLSDDSSTALLTDDGLIAPEAPTLKITATAGKLTFGWQHNIVDAVQSISLYQYNQRTKTEKMLDATINSTAQQYELNTPVHQLAWDSNSFRVELCTNDNCLSSARVAIDGLMVHAVSAISPSDEQIRTGFADAIALNATGNISVVTNSAQRSASVFFRVNARWTEATRLFPQTPASNAPVTLKPVVSANGDTIAIASVTSNAAPIVTVFDRLGENWIESDTLRPEGQGSTTDTWNTQTLGLALSANGDRMAFGLQRTTTGNVSFANTTANNRILVFDRNTVSWSPSATLMIPQTYLRSAAFTASANLDRIVALSTHQGQLHAHTFDRNNNAWQPSALFAINSIDSRYPGSVVSNGDATEIVVAGWESSSSAQRTPVAWRIKRDSTLNWSIADSVRLPPTYDQSATIRLSADRSLNSLAIGWQGVANADVAFYATANERWHHQFSAPAALYLDRALPMAQSLAISADNSTAMIGTTNTGAGGVVTVFQ